MGGPQPAAPEPAQVHAELIETRSGWVLTVTLTAALADSIRASHADELERVIGADHVTMSIAPNLVPGTPFLISSVKIVLA
jgi:hypothetical protein